MVTSRVPQDSLTLHTMPNKDKTITIVPLKPINIAEEGINNSIPDRRRFGFVFNPTKKIYISEVTITNNLFRHMVQ